MNPSTKSVASWPDQAYHWQNLATESQAPRYRAIAQIAAEHETNHIIDAGCGEAVLAAFLPQHVAYTGFEPSRAACINARDRLTENGRCPDVRNCTVEAFKTTGKVPCIVFNEMLYYLSNPCAQLIRYREMLADDGIFIISIYQHEVGLSPQTIKWWMRSALTGFRRSHSNPHCTRMVLDLCKDEGWKVVGDRDVLIPGHSRHWRILTIKP